MGSQLKGMGAAAISFLIFYKIYRKCGKRAAE